MFSSERVTSKISRYIDEQLNRHSSHASTPGRQTQSQPQLWHAENQRVHQTTFIGHQIHRSLFDRPLKIAHVEELGNVASLSTRVERDLGFQGQLGPYILLSYGDTMYRDEDWSDKFIGMTCNSVGLATMDPTKVIDPLLNETGHPQFFLKPSPEFGEDYGEDALGITNVVETSPGKGTHTSPSCALSSPAPFHVCTASASFTFYTRADTPGWKASCSTYSIIDLEDRIDSLVQALQKSISTPNLSIRSSLEQNVCANIGGAPTLNQAMVMCAHSVMMASFMLTVT